jgi:quinol monooxygenase YgiN
VIRLFVRHTVADPSAWRKGYDEFDATRRSMGVTDDAVYQSIDSPNDITVTHDFESDSAAKAFMTSDELKSAMANAGVQGQPEVWITSPS